MSDNEAAVGCAAWLGAIPLWINWGWPHSNIYLPFPSCTTPFSDKWDAESNVYKCLHFSLMFLDVWTPPGVCSDWSGNVKLQFCLVLCQPSSLTGALRWHSFCSTGEALCWKLFLFNANQIKKGICTLKVFMWNVTCDTKRIRFIYFFSHTIGLFVT